MTNEDKPECGFACGKMESVTIYFETNACFQDTIERIESLPKIRIHDHRERHSGNVMIHFNDNTKALLYESGNVHFHTKVKVHTPQEIECMLLQGYGYGGLDTIGDAERILRGILVPSPGETLRITPNKLGETRSLDRVRLPPNFRYDGVQPGIGINVKHLLYICDSCGKEYKSEYWYIKHKEKCTQLP